MTILIPDEVKSQMLHSLFLPENVMHSEDINKTFLSAIQDGHLEDVQLCLHNHADIEARNEVL